MGVINVFISSSFHDDFNEFKTRSDDLGELVLGKGEFEGYDFMINEQIPLILANAEYAIAQTRK